ncbi:hypothetical protein BLNAU_15072 [Blattamonas nauphoetae]|uniref:Uncharacterized protein n=1 Tax=Blattamonas nauphoetae TaxID=2049346 RepID=A0ABQ9XHC2_9EUKA|nr:hypothetical protein BLNAU_15072 [Blattamonas nauphoetae]
MLADFGVESGEGGTKILVEATHGHITPFGIDEHHCLSSRVWMPKQKQTLRISIATLPNNLHSLVHVILSKTDAVLVLNVEPREMDGYSFRRMGVVRVEGKSVTESPPIRHDEKTSSPDETRKRGEAEQAEC